MIVPTRSNPALAPAAPPLQLPSLQPAVTPTPSIDLPKLVEAFQTANVSVGGLFLKVEDEDIERAFKFLRSPASSSFPEHRLSQSVFQHSHAREQCGAWSFEPDGSRRSGGNILPAGSDTVPASGDDPLRMARLGNPPAEQARALPVTLPGVDGKLGTADDILVIAPQQSGNSEHLVEGLREGTHTLEMKVSAMLHGLPIDPVPSAAASWAPSRCAIPTFALTLRTRRRSPPAKNTTCS